MSESAQAILLPIFASFAIVLLIVPFMWHWNLKNVGACSLIFYLTLANCFTFVNAIIWPDENYDSWWDGAGLCDIEVKLKWPHVTGLTCATLCITRNLANVFDVSRQEFSQTRASRGRKRAIDVAICFTIPVLQILLHYIIQPNRYLITAVGGCTESYDNSWPTILIMFMWPPVFCLAAFYYAACVIVRLRKYRAQFASILSASSSNLTTARYLRLYIMSLTLLLIYAPVCIYFFYVNLDITWLSYDWNAIHDPEVWWTVPYLPALGVRTFDCWVSIVMSFFMFAYFGMGGEAVELYRKLILSIGLGKLFPGLNRPRRHRKPNESTSWSSQFSLISRAKNYLDSSRKNSTATTLDSIIDRASGTRKPSAGTVESITGDEILLPLGNYQSGQLPDFISPISPIPPPSNPTTRELLANPSVTYDKRKGLPEALLPTTNTQRSAQGTKLSFRNDTILHAPLSTFHVTPQSGEPVCKASMRKQEAVNPTPYIPLKADLTTKVWSSKSPYSHNRLNGRGLSAEEAISEDVADAEPDFPAGDWENCVYVGTKIDRRESYQATCKHHRRTC